MGTTPELIATAPTDRQKKIERIAEAATWWVYDQSCPNALADLEYAVEDLVGVPVESGN